MFDREKDAARRARANRGKAAEKLVREYLDWLSGSVAKFNYERRYDARSAGGKFPAQAGDYAYWRDFSAGAVSGFIEVKEVAHDFRVPQKNFTKEKIGRLRAKYIAGADVVILVLHTTTHLWRRVPFFVFEQDPAAKSWDLTEFTTYVSVTDALADLQALAL